MHEQDSSIDATPLTSMEAAQEVVADMMGLILKGGGNLIHQMAAEEPGTARRILDSIKSFLKKLAGSDGEWKSDTRREMLETALKDKQNVENGRNEFSIDGNNLLSSDEMRRLESNLNDQKYRGYKLEKRPNGGFMIAMDNTLAYTDAKANPE